ncbi:SHD1 domain-containing protein [Roseibacillus persicicus]|nr:SHD1 domain-containing protein [Roseibacillus persicicus]
MKSSIQRCGAMACFAFLIGQDGRAQVVREWTSADGRTLQGAYLEGDEEKVKLRKRGGTVVEIPLKQLSKEDRELVLEKVEAEQERAREANGELEKEKLLAGPFTYQLSDGHENWPEDRKKRIVDAMEAAVIYMNKHGKFKKHVYANNSPGTPTADANFDGWINWGGSISRRVALHEFSHTLGVGTHPNWRKNIKDGKWTGEHALTQLREFDGPDAVLYADRQHFWPYGLNFDNESSEVNDLRFVKMLEALRKDMGLE